MRWFQNAEDFPKKFKRLAGVNLRDKRQYTEELFPWLRFSKFLIDYYLEHLVFPKEMKEFSNKLSSSGWEIAREKRHPTTGFSGTNDSKVSQASHRNTYVSSYVQRAVETLCLDLFYEINTLRHSALHTHPTGEDTY